MLPFRTILFPVDYSEPCAAIAPYVSEMQQRFSAGLGIIHAYGPEALAYSDLAITDPRLPEETKTLQEERLARFAQTTFPGLHVDLFTGIGEPASVIHEVVKREGADLVMLPTHGRGPLRRMLLGSITSKLLHDLTVPVWTGHPLRIPYRSVLCALDTNTYTDTTGEGTDGANYEANSEPEAVLRAAISLAASYNARLTLVSVLEMPADTAEMPSALYKNNFIATTNTILEKLKRKVGTDAPHTVVEGLIPQAIQKEALRLDADLIVTGRGISQGAFSRWWSQLYPIIRHAPCPVLSI